MTAAERVPRRGWLQSRALRFPSPRQIVVFLMGVLWIVAAHPAAVAPAQVLVGVVLVLLGELLRIWATGNLRKNKELTIGGPYQYIRDPMYLGSLLIGTGITLAGGDIGLMVAFLALYFLFYMPRKRRIETRRLWERFGDEYVDYLVSVDSLSPRVYPYKGRNASTFSWETFHENGDDRIIFILLLALAVLALKFHWHPAWLSAPSWVPRWL